MDAHRSDLASLADKIASLDLTDGERAALAANLVGADDEPEVTGHQVGGPTLDPAAGLGFAASTRRPGTSFDEADALFGKLRARGVVR